MKSKILFVYLVFFIFLSLNILLYFYRLHNYATQSISSKPLEVKYTNTYHETISSPTLEPTYPNLLKCNTFYNTSKNGNSSLEADIHLQELRIVRGIIFYYSAENSYIYENELKWLYRSWIEMQIYEPKLWRTDLIVFSDTHVLGKNNSLFKSLHCLEKNIRKTKTDKPMCRLIDYKPLKNRTEFQNIPFVNDTMKDLFKILHESVDIFDDDPINLLPFYRVLNHLNNYTYIDSILIAFDGYKELDGEYDFLLRTDVDVFLTPLFAKWLPLNCNDFIVGIGAYSTDFNMKRLKRIASDLKFEFSNTRNPGSTWFSTPIQFRFISYYTLVSMAYIANEEFTQVEQSAKLGALMWPDWHYGVLSLYGENLAMNHFIAKKQLNIKLENLIDYPATGNRSVFDVIHIHCYHTDDIFSKFAFQRGAYDRFIKSDFGNTNVTKWYSLAIALESRRIPTFLLYHIFKNVVANKL